MLDRNYFLTQLVCKFVMKCGKKKILMGIFAALRSLN